MSPASRFEVEELLRSLVGGQEPEQGETIIWDAETGWRFGGAPSYAGIKVDKNTDPTLIYAKEVFHQFHHFTELMVESRSQADFGNNHLDIRDTGDYAVFFFLEGESDGVNKQYEANAFEIKEAKKNITGITQGDPCVVTCPNHQFKDDQRVFTSDIGGMVEVDTQVFVVERVDEDTINLIDEDGDDLDATGYTAYTSGGTLQLATILTPHTDTKWTGGSALESVSGGGMNNLTNGNKLILCLENETDVTDFIVEGVTFFMIKLSR
jgi:hypothetical protein